MQSVAFSTKEACLAGVEDFQRSAVNDANFIRVLARDRTHFFALNSDSNHLIAVSQSYPTAAMMELDIVAVQTGTPTALIAESCGARVPNLHTEHDGLRTPKWRGDHAETETSPKRPPKPNSFAETQLPLEETKMQDFDLYLNPKRPTLGLYVKAGAELPGLADAAEWQHEGTVDASELPSDVLAGVEANGHAFQELGD